ncbi:MAG: hypothetical protein MUE51_07645 [Thermoleophilia bacterium]|jgi:heme oxygenase|nr:hypothetical protein [Thermoleophilia bacterium]
MGLPGLRAQTRDLHERLEARVLIARPFASADAYGRWLVALHGWLAPLEEALGARADLTAAGLPAPAGRAAPAAADLAALGRVPGPRAPIRLPADTPAAVGVAYVLEGQARGGAAIAARLAAAGWGPVPHALLDRSGTAGRWRAFCAAAAPLAADPRAAAGARDAFAVLERWLEDRGVIPPGA